MGAYIHTSKLGFIWIQDLFGIVYKAQIVISSKSITICWCECTCTRAFLVAQSYVAVVIIGSSSLSALEPGHSCLRKAAQSYVVVVTQVANWGWFNNTMILVTSYLLVAIYKLRYYSIYKKPVLWIACYALICVQLIVKSFYSNIESKSSNNSLI